MIDKDSPDRVSLLLAVVVAILAMATVTLDSLHKSVKSARRFYLYLRRILMGRPRNLRLGRRWPATGVLANASSTIVVAGPFSKLTVTSLTLVFHPAAAPAAGTSLGVSYGFFAHPPADATEFSNGSPVTGSVAILFDAESDRQWLLPVGIEPTADSPYFAVRIDNNSGVNADGGVFVWVQP